MFVKFSKCSILGTSFLTKGRVASKKVLSSFEYDDRGEGFLYVAVRACTADVPNLNKDMLPHNELKTAYRTFLGKPVYVNHSNTNLDRARGFIIDAVYHDEDPEDRWIEILMEMDEVTFPKLCSLIRNGEIDTVSMGLNCETTTCSVCGNVAEQPSQFCEHIKQKGRNFNGIMSYEICNGIGFFEESWVYDPADPTALVQALEVENKTAARAVRKTAQYDEDEEDTFTVGIAVYKYDFDGDVVDHNDEMEVIDEVHDFEEAKRIADSVDPELYIETLEAGPLKAAVSSACVVILSEEEGTFVYEGPCSDSTLKAPYDARNELVEYVEDHLSGSPTIDLSFAPGSWETFYVQWRSLDISQDMMDALDDADVSYYCKVRVSNHEASDSTSYSEPTGYVSLSSCRSFDDVVSSVADEYSMWLSDVETIIGGEAVSRMAFNTKRIARSVDRAVRDFIKEYEALGLDFENYDELAAETWGIVEDFGEDEEFYVDMLSELAGHYKLAKTADNMVNKLRIPEEVDMQNSDRVCPICGSPDFDGVYCDVCEYVEYAEGFGDIDTEEAQENKEQRKSLDDVETPNEEITDDVEQDYEDEGRIAAQQFDISANREEALDGIYRSGYKEGIDYDLVGVGDTIVSYSVSMNGFMTAGHNQH